MWEDPANSGGGKWVLTMKSNPTLLDRSWSWLVFALVGEELDDAGAAAPGSSNPGNNDTDEICGAVVSLRSKVDRIQVWTRSKDVERVNKIGKRLIKLLDVSEKDGIGLDFQVCCYIPLFFSMMLLIKRLILSSSSIKMNARHRQSIFRFSQRSPPAASVTPLRVFPIRAAV